MKEKLIKMGIKYNDTYSDICSLSHKYDLTRLDVMEALDLIEEYNNLHDKLMINLKKHFQSKL